MKRKSILKNEMNLKVLLTAVITIVIIIASANVVSAEANPDIFDAVSILEHLSGNENFNESEISNLDVDCNCEITLQDVFIMVQNNVMEQYDNYNTCDLSCNDDFNFYIQRTDKLVDKVVMANEKIKNYTYEGHLTGNARGSTNGTASGNYTVVIFGLPFTYSFSDTLFNSNFDAFSNGSYDGSYERNNNSGNIGGDITANINGSVTATVSGISTTQSINETNTAELHENINNADIYDISVEILKHNSTKISLEATERRDGIDCYKIEAIPDKSAVEKLIKSYYLYGILLNLSESNIKNIRITYWIDKKNFSIILECLDVEIENFTQKINKTFEINQCKDNLCVKNVTVDTINITKGHITSHLKFKCVNKSYTLQPSFNPDDVGNLSDIVESGPVDEKTVVNLTTKDRVAFFFLHNPGCSHCFDAEQHLPEIQQMFGQRMIIYKLKVRESESQPWTGYAADAGLNYYPFTLAIGMHSVENGILNKSKTGMTSGSGVYEEWKKNICMQFKNPPSNCSKYLN